jgi:hypothetical protein
MRNIFVLSKREQRVVIVIMMILVAAALANHYRERSQDSAARSLSPAPSITPALSPLRQGDLEHEDAP